MNPKYPYIASICPPAGGKRGWYDVISWCHEKIGATHSQYVGEGVFAFENESDYMMFLLRWS